MQNQLKKGGALSIKSLSMLTSLNLLTAIVGLSQTIIIAQIFGASRAIETYFAATTFQNFLLQISTSGQIGDLFIPIFHNIQAESGKEASYLAFSAMTNVMFVIAIAFAVLGCIFANSIVAMLVPGFDKDEKLLCAHVFLVTAPLTALHVFSGMCSNFLRAEHQYGTDETLSLGSRIVNLIILLTLSWAWGIWALILGLWMSGLIRFFGQQFYVWRLGYRHKLGFATAEFSPWTVFCKVPFTFIHISASQFFAFALTAALSSLPEGSYAVYNYAKQLSSKLQGLILRPIGILFFSRFSQALAEGRSQVIEYASHALALSVASIAICVVPVACGGDYLLMAIWGGDNFSVAQIKETHLILVSLTVLLLANAQYLISRRTNLALKNVVQQFAASGIVLVIAGASCMWAISKFGLWGAVAIQYMAGFGSALITLAVLFFVRRELVAIAPLKKCFAWTLTAIGAIFITMNLRSAVHVKLDADRFHLMAAAAGFGLFSLAVCLGISWLIRIPESREIALKLKTKFAKV